MSDTEFHVDSRETLQNAPTTARSDQATDISTAIHMLTVILAQQQQQMLPHSSLLLCFQLPPHSTYTWSQTKSTMEPVKDTHSGQA